MRASEGRVGTLKISSYVGQQQQQQHCQGKLTTGKGRGKCVYVCVGGGWGDGGAATAPKSSTW